MARPRPTVVVVGAIGMQIPRSPFYEKELSLTISCSYGPAARPLYEQAGIDYPVGHVRWTENRNMQASLELMARGQLDTRALLSHRFEVERATDAYDVITGRAGDRYLGVLLEYPTRGAETTRRVEIAPSAPHRPLSDGVVAGFVGAGNFATAHLLPQLVRSGVTLAGVCTTRPVSARSVAEQFNFDFCATDAAQVIGDERVNAVFIATRHDSHAHYVVEALECGNDVFVEKPLAVSRDQLADVEAIARRSTAAGHTSPSGSIAASLPHSARFRNSSPIVANRCRSSTG